MRLRILHASAVDALALNSRRNPSHYLDTDSGKWRSQCNFDNERWFFDSPGDLLPPSDAITDSLSQSRHIPGSDAMDSIALYRVLDMLAPQQAADERFWVSLSHYELYSYCQKRWGGNLPNPVKDHEKSANYIRLRWFVRNTRVLIRDNAVSRLWWMGRFFHKAAEHAGMEPEAVAKTLLKSTDVRDHLFGRPASIANVRLLAAITRAIKEEPAVLDRQTFRQLMVRLNQRAGAILIDGLDTSELSKVVEKEVNGVLNPTQA